MSWTGATNRLVLVLIVALFFGGCWSVADSAGVGSNSDGAPGGEAAGGGDAGDSDGDEGSDSETGDGPGDGTDSDEGSDDETDDDTGSQCNPTFVMSVVAPAYKGVKSVQVADLDGDDDLDVIAGGVGLPAEDGVVWFENTTGAAKDWRRRIIADYYDSTTAVHTADMDGDGDIDVVAASPGILSLSWWNNLVGDGTSWGEYPVVNEKNGLNGIDAADLDQDGDLDLLGSAPVEGEIVWWENSPLSVPVWQVHIVGDSFQESSSVQAADMDGDGDLDAIGSARRYGKISWWENDMADKPDWWVEHVVTDGFRDASSVHAADMDGDGDLDVLGAAFTADEIAWWENSSGDGTGWVQHLVTSGFMGAKHVTAADLDGDGDLDVLGAAHSEGQISWWENSASNGTSWEEHVLSSTAEGANAVFAADLDGDGDMDIVGGAGDVDMIVWWESDCAP